MNRRLVESGLPQVDHPHRKARRLPGFWLWTVPLTLSLVLLFSTLREPQDIDVEAPLFGFAKPFALLAASVLLFLVWSWRSRGLPCPRCRRRLSRVARDEEYAYYPCRVCGVMWRSAADRSPAMDVDDD